MIELNLGGGCPRRSLIHVLPRAMVLPNPSPYESLPGINFAVASMNGALRKHIPVLASSVQSAGRPMLVVAFADAKLPVCTGMTLFRPVPAGVEVGMVEPCLARDDEAIMLLAADRSKLFKLDARSELVERRVPKAARNGDGIERAWSDLKRRMTELTQHTGRFPLASWEVHVEPG
jgi:hypothetical protein